MSEQQQQNTVAVDRAVPVPHLDQWLGYWLIEPERGLKKLAVLQQMNLTLHLAGQQAAHDDESKPQTGRWQTQASPLEGERVAVKSGYGYTLAEGGVAIVEMNGTLMKHEASDESSTSTVMLRRTVRAMRGDDRVKAVIFDIDSPGGTVAGAYDLADDIAALSAAKPTFAYARDMAASAAYLQASQTRSISAGRTALVGSIGTVGVVYDTSARAAMMGIRAHVMAGRINGQPAPMKGAGMPGSEITPEQLQRWQEEIDDLNEQFLAAVERGRGKSRQKVLSWADGGVWIAEKARAMGMIDRVESFDELVARARRQGASAGGTSAGGDGRRGEAAPINAITDAGGCSAGAQIVTQAAPVPGPGDGMSQNDTAPAAGTQQAGAETAPASVAQQQQQQQQTEQAGGPRPATIAELESAFAGEDRFVLQAAKNGWTITEATSAFAVIKADRDRRPAAGSSGGNVARRPGVPALESAPERGGGNGIAVGGGSGSAVEQFDAAVIEKQKQPGFENRKRAIDAVCRQQPELHRAMLLETNQRGVHGMINQRFGE
jgi:signal peptide peptidase SppA